MYILKCRYIATCIHIHIYIYTYTCIYREAARRGGRRGRGRAPARCRGRRAHCRFQAVHHRCKRRIFVQFQRVSDAEIRAGLAPSQRPTQSSIGAHLLSRNVEQFRGGLVFKAHKLWHHSTAGSRELKKRSTRFNAVNRLQSRNPNPSSRIPNPEFRHPQPEIRNPNSKTRNPDAQNALDQVQRGEPSLLLLYYSRA